MKKTFGRLILASLLIAVVLSVAAFAATNEYEPGTDGTYSIAHTDATLANKYVSMVVVEGIYEEGDTPEISEDTVLYVGQQTADANGAVTFADWTPKSDSPASVYVGKQGGTEVELIGYINNNMVRVYGKVTSLIPGGTKHEATVIAKTESNEVVTSVATVNGEYSMYLSPEVKLQIRVEMTAHAPMSGSHKLFTEDTEYNFLNVQPQHSEEFIYDYNGDGAVDSFDYMVNANTVGGYSASERTSSTMVYSYADDAITATLTPDTKAWGYIRQVVSFDKTMLNVAAGADNYKSAFVLPTGATLKDYSATTNGNIVTVDISYYNLDNISNAATEEVVLTINAPLASGVTEGDFQYNTFKVESVAYANKGYNYYNVAGQTTNIEVTNNLTGHFSMTEIEVTAGEKVYLQDGSLVVAETTGPMEIPATEGYVAINVGKASQRTYYVNGEATQVHTNAVVGSDKTELRDRTKTAHGEDRNGIRFEMKHNSGTRNVTDHKVVETGFVITTNADGLTNVLAGHRHPAAQPEDRELITIEAVNLGAAVKGTAYRENGTDIVFNSEDDGAWIIKAVFYNIPITERGVQTDIICRPYYKVNDTYIYGEATRASLAQVAKAIKGNAETWDGSTANMKAYIEEILALVPETEVKDAEVIIDITNLFEMLNLA